MEAKVAAAMRWLDTMPTGKRLPVTEWQAGVVRTWIQRQPEIGGEIDGGMNFNATFTEIYKMEILPVSEKWQDKKLEK